MTLDPHVQATIDDYDRRVEVTGAFLRQHLDTDVAIGALRLLSGHLPEFCPDCGATCDFALGIYCSCWSKITPDNRPTWVPIEDDPEGPDV